MNLVFALGTWGYNGAEMAAGCATDLVMPVGLIWTFSLIAMITFYGCGNRRSAIAMAGLFSLVTLTGNGSVASMMIGSVEMPRNSLSATDVPLRSLVVLGGAISIAYDDVPELGRAGQRMFSTAEYWFSDQTQSIICTGTSPVSELGPSKAGRMMLESLKIPSAAIFEVPGHNTTQEMENLAVFFHSPPEDFPSKGKIGLVTSAFHMRRAMRLAEAQGLDFIPLPCGYDSPASYEWTPRALVPKADAMGVFSRALKERLAKIVGR
ncbi:YdcF family protein [Novipirellula herctigrandis]|uniref:YdcF family protein n=1 Tax=Novipirellula herctigrandis TaxID=2527986 RepID=UPI003AF400CA